MKSYSITQKVWQWPNPTSIDGGWHFVTLPKEISAKIRKVQPKGMVSVEVALHKSTWHASLFPHTLSQAYILCIPKKIRKQEGIFKGDEVKIKFGIIKK